MVGIGNSTLSVLTPRQQPFGEREYLIDLDGTQPAIQGGLQRAYSRQEGGAAIRAETRPRSLPGGPDGRHRRVRSSRTAQIRSMWLSH
jgi:hypothetical protein